MYYWNNFTWSLCSCFQSCCIISEHCLWLFSLYWQLRTLFSALNSIYVRTLLNLLTIQMSAGNHWDWCDNELTRLYCVLVCRDRVRYIGIQVQTTGLTFASSHPTDVFIYLCWWRKYYVWNLIQLCREALAALGSNGYFHPAVEFICVL